MEDKLNKILGIGEHQLKNKYVCFLPIHAEFGWYLQIFVKRVQGYNHSNKIVCIKKGHECLFPSAQEFYYDWQDIEDNQKAGIILNTNEEIIKNKVMTQFRTDDICFLSSSETSWDEKISLANNTFIPKSLHNKGLKTDIIICPRKREIDTHRNWAQENWQIVVDELVKNNLTIGVCGNKNTSYELNNVLYKSYDYIDVDSDIELMNNAKLVIVQESGLQYLSFMCERPTFCIDHYMPEIGADLHRNKSVPFKHIEYVWHDPQALVKEILTFIR